MFRSAAFATVLLALLGCSKDLIPNTEVENTPENHEVIDFCETYRIALEAKDFARIVAMTADDYYEDGASPPGRDDYDHAGLQQRLSGRFSRLEEVLRHPLPARVVLPPDRRDHYCTTAASRSRGRQGRSRAGSARSGTTGWCCGARPTATRS